MASTRAGQRNQVLTFRSSAGAHSNRRGNVRRRPRGKGIRVVLAAWPVAVTAAFTILLAWALPLTYDEAHNWSAYASQGTGFITHNYPAPNNQVLFTLLQSLLPASWVNHDPLMLRLINVVVAVAIIQLMYSWLVRAGVNRVLSLAALLLCGPLTVLYLGVARGYLFGTLLAFLALHLLAHHRGVATALSAGILFAFAIYTIPTFAFGMVGVGVLLLWQRRIKELVLGGAVAAAIALALYQPILHQVLGQTARAYKHLPPQGTGAYALEAIRSSLYLTAFGSSTLTWVILAVAAAALAIAAGLQYGSRFGELVSRGLQRRRTPAPQAIGADRFDRDGTTDSDASMIFQFVTAYALGDLAVIAGAHLLHNLAEPYYRNSLFLGWTLMLLLLRALRSGRWLRRVAAVVIAANVVIGAVGVTLLVRGSDYSPSRYEYTVISTAPRALRNVAQLGATRVQCSFDDVPACTLYTDYLARRGVRVTATEWITDRHRCLVGRRKPSYKEGILVFRRDRELGMLCTR